MSDVKSAPETLTIPLPVNNSDMNLFMDFAANCVTVKIEMFAVVLPDGAGGQYMRSDDCEGVAESFRHEEWISCFNRLSTTEAV